MTANDLVDRIVQYESGDMDERAEIELIAELIRTGQAYSLQGHYGRAATAYIRAGIISEDGQVLV